MASIDKRGNVWRARVRIKGFSPRTRSFDTKAEAGGMGWGKSANTIRLGGTGIYAMLEKAWGNPKAVHVDRDMRAADRLSEILRLSEPTFICVVEW